MRKTRKTLSAVLATMLVIGTAGCGGGVGRAPAIGETGEATAANTTAVTTEDPNKEIDEKFDYKEAADIDTVDTANETGVGSLYESGKPAGTIHALCWFDFHNVSPELDIAEVFAERFGGTVETEIVSSLEITDRLGKPKYKLTYTTEQMQIYDDLVDPSKFSFVFDTHYGFGLDLSNQLEEIYNAPISEGESYNRLVGEYYNMVESALDEYRKMTAQ